MSPSGNGRAPGSSFQPLGGSRTYGGDDAAKGDMPAVVATSVPVWPAVLGAGLVLLVLALVLRYALQPRAG